MMTPLMGMLCRFWKCAGKSKDSSPPDEKNSGDDLRRIRGIGIATENRLYRAGVRSYAELARATPEELREILGKLGRGADFEAWIAEAKKLISAK